MEEGLHQGHDRGVPRGSLDVRRSLARTDDASIRLLDWRTGVQTDGPGRSESVFVTSSGLETGQHSSRSLFKNILGSSGLYSLTLVGQRVAGMALLPIYTRYLTPANYGTLELLDQVVAVLSILLGANFSSALAYFYFEKDSTENREAASGTVVAGSLLIGTLVGAVGWVFSGVLSKVVFGSDGYVLFLRISFGGIVLSFLFEAIMSWFRVTDR